MVITLAILGKCILIEKLSDWKWRMHIYTPGWHTFDFVTFVSLSVPSVSPPGAGGVPSGDSLLGRARCGGGAALSLLLQRVCGCFGVPFWHGRHPAV